MRRPWDPDANPANIGNPNPNYNYSVAANWSTGIVPIGYLPASFDGIVDNAPCNINEAINSGADGEDGPVFSVINSYSATITIVAGVNNVSIDSIQEDQGNESLFHLDFADTAGGNTQTFNIMGTYGKSSVITNMILQQGALDGNPNQAVFSIASSTSEENDGETLGLNGNLEYLDDVQMLIDGNSSVQLYPTQNSVAGLKLVAGSFIEVGDGGTFNLTDAYTPNPKDGVTYIIGDGANNIGQEGEQITIDYGGQMSCWNSGVDNINVPIVNNGTFTLDGGTLLVYGPADNATHYSFIAQPTTGTVWTMLFDTDLYCDQGYAQTASAANMSILEVTSTDANEPSTITANSNGIYIGEYSVVEIDPEQTDFATLNLNSTSAGIYFDGSLYVSVSAAGSDSDNVNFAQSTIWFGPDAYIDATVVGGVPEQGASWFIFSGNDDDYNGWSNVSVNAGFAIDNSPGIIDYAP